MAWLSLVSLFLTFELKNATMMIESELNRADDWTSTTRDGERSAQFEHTLLVTPNGCEVYRWFYFIFPSFSCIDVWIGVDKVWRIRYCECAASRGIGLHWWYALLLINMSIVWWCMYVASRIAAPAHFARFAKAVNYNFKYIFPINNIELMNRWEWKWR